MKAGGIVIGQSGTNIDNQMDIDCGFIDTKTSQDIDNRWMTLFGHVISLA